MAGNPVTSLPVDMLFSVKDIKLLDIRDMELRSLPVGFIPDGTILNTITLSGNPWKCDCDVAPLLSFIRYVATSSGAPKRRFFGLISHTTPTEASLTVKNSSVLNRFG